MSFEFGIFRFTKLTGKTCRIGVGNGKSSSEGNALINKNSQITTIIIPSFAKDETTQTLFTVTETNVYSFKNYNSITSITLPDTLQFIGQDSFYGTSVEYLVIPQNVNSLDEAAFSNMKMLKTLTFQPGSKIQTLKWATFAYCYNLTTIIIPPSVTQIFRAFNFSSTLQSIYYCGSSDLSDANAEWSVSSINIFVTQNYPKDSKFAGKDVQIDTTSACIPYLYYHSRICSQKSYCQRKISVSVLLLLFLMI